ncbi:dicarboxylate/amino acid:cation symporter [Aquabacter spiritensis]|uniref:dicarboxylate/amino acid:cation symporter n=1 Tax=Aquabacter spiritensis TaxID=933073 RepID=UPI001FE12C7B|nr:dicarboxylate/amino acid:cation symporter [Aquabacter spiritensis]
MKHKLTMYIVAALVLGVAVGYVLNTTLAPAEAATVADHISLITEIFLRLVKMIIGPLVFTSLVAGVAHMGDMKTIGRVGGKAMVWFVSASLVSLLIGMLMVNLLQPGANLNIPLPAAGTATGVQGGSFSLAEFIKHAVPNSAVGALANNEVLQIVIFSILFGLAAAAVGHKAKVLVGLIEEGSHVILKVTGYVMSLAPLAVFSAIAAIVTEHGPGILLTYGKYIFSFYLSLFILWCVMFAAGYLILGKTAIRVLSLVRAPFVVAFTTASSEAAYPSMMRQLERVPVSEKIVSFVLPLGYSFNLDGSMMYCTFAVLFIAQAYGIEIGWGQQIVMLLALMITSKGMGAVPRGSLVVVAATLDMFHLPAAGLLLVLGVDQFLDMGRSATNVIGNGIATTVVAKWEGEDVDSGFDDRDEEIAIAA